MEQLLDAVRKPVRGVMRMIARALNTISGGRVSPNAITIVGLVAHLPIAWLIYDGHLLIAGVWLIVFGLFDTLDGELARLQKRSSPAGMFLDSVTDRMKEVLIYVGIGTYFMSMSFYEQSCGGRYFDCFHVQENGTALLLATLILTLGGSMLTSYINAWGEAVLSRSGAKNVSINKAFRGGLGSFEIRMAIIVTGLLTGWLFLAVLLIGLLVALTILQRIRKVFRELGRVQG